MRQLIVWLMVVGVLAACDEKPSFRPVPDVTVDTVDDGSGAVDADEDTPSDTAIDSSDSVDDTEDVPDSADDTATDGSGTEDAADGDDATDGSGDAADATDAGDAPDTADVADAPDLADLPDVGPVQSLVFVFDSSGGFTGMGTTDISLGPDGVLHVSGGPLPTCDGELTDFELATLLAATGSVDWGSVAGAYYPPSNPSCCCDQYAYELDVTVTFDGDEPANWVVEWCDQSMIEEIVPESVVSFIEAIAGVAATMIARECPT